MSTKKKGLVKASRDSLLTYETDLDLEVGDQVVLPRFPWQMRWDEFPIGTVVALESDYDGPCRSIISKSLHEVDDAG